MMLACMPIKRGVGGRRPQKKRTEKKETRTRESRKGRGRWAEAENLQEHS
jgi:hypothetical protein